MRNLISALPAGVRLVYTTPAHQYPTGVVLAPDGQTALERLQDTLKAWAPRRKAEVA